QAGQLPEAERAYRQALPLCERLAADFPNVPEFRQQLAATQQNLGMLLFTEGRLKEAEEACRSTVTLLDQLANEFPKRPEVHSAHMRAWRQLGVVLRQTAPPGAAERAFRQALDHAEQGAVAFPGRPEFQLLAAQNANSLAWDLTSRPEPLLHQVAEAL